MRYVLHLLNYPTVAVSFVSGLLLVYYSSGLVENTLFRAAL